MLYPLLLDAAPAAQGTPVTVYVTIGAAVLAALASLNATRVSSKTAREVATLSAQTAQESARLAAQTAQELKERDYKNDFYKKIIERRLKAWETAEQLIALILPAVRDKTDNQPLPYYFSNTDAFDQVISHIKIISVQNFWLGSSLANCMSGFNAMLMNVRKDCVLPGFKNPDNTTILDKQLLFDEGKNRYGENKILLTTLVQTLGKKIATIHDVDAFFKDLEMIDIKM